MTHFHRGLSGALSVVLFSTIAPLRAQTWNVNADGNWGTSSNWSPGTVPNAVGATVTLGNIITANRTITVNGGTRTLGTLNINDNNNYTLTSGTLSFDVSSGSAAINVSNSGSPLISSAISMQDNLVITQNGTGTLDIDGAIDTNAKVLTIQGTGTTWLDGAISDSGSLIKSGTGTLRLSNNSFSGGLTVNAGTVQFNHNNATGTGTLTLNGGNIEAVNAARTIDDAVTVGGNFGVVGSQNLTMTGNMALGSSQRTITVDNTGATTFGGVISGTGGIVKEGDGVLTLSGSAANTYSGSTTINEGDLRLQKSTGNAIVGNVTVGDGTGTDFLRIMASNQIGDSSTVTVNSSGQFLFNGAFTETIGSLNLTGGTVNTGTGTLTLGGSTAVVSNASATSSTISGNLAIQSSSKIFDVADGAAANDLNIAALVSGTGGITKNGAGVLVLSNGSNSYTGVTTLNAGTVSISSLGNGGSASGIGSASNAAANIVFNGGALTYTGAAASSDRSFTLGTGGGTINSSGSGALTLSGSITNSGSGARTLTLGGTNTGANTLSAAIADGSGGATSLVKNDTGTWVLGGSSANTYTGNTTVNGGELQLQKSSGNAIAGNLTIGDGTGTDVVRLMASNQIGDSSTVTVNSSGQFLFNSNQTETIGGLNLTGGTVNTSTGTLTLGNSTAVVSNASANSSTIAGNLAIQTTSKVFDVADGAAANDLVVSALVSGTGGITKEGAGVLVLSNGSNSYTGVTTFNAGTVSISSLGNGGSASGIGSASNAAANMVFNGGALTYTGAATSSNRSFTLGTGGGTINSSGSGALTLSGSITNSGSGARTLTLGGTNTDANTLSAAISDSGGATSVVKNDSGTWVLGGSSGNTYSGNTTVNGGELRLQKSSGNAVGANLTVNSGGIARLMSSNQIGDSNTVTVNGGQFVFNSNQTETIGSLNLTGGSVNTGTGSLTLTADPAITSNASATSSTIAGNLYLQGSKTISVADGAAGIDLDISANILDQWFSTITKTGDGTLKLSGNNTFQGPLQINDGIVIAASNNALGSTGTWGNSVANGAALHLTGGITLSEGNIKLNGTGPDGLGALRTLSGANTFTATLTVESDSKIGADAGSSLALAGPIDLANKLTFAGAGNFNASGQISGAGVLEKTGSGTLQFSGSGYDINGARLDVLEGTVELNRAGRQLNTQQGPVVGTTSGPSATLKLLQDNQIRDDMFVTVKESGTLDLNGKNDGVAGLKLYGGAVQTGAGTLTIANAGGDEIHAYASGQTATISGKLKSDLSQGVTITTDSGANLDISAAFSGSATTVTKKGAGTLTYSGTQANTYTGQTVIDAGTLTLNKTSGVDAIAGSSIKVNSGGTLLLANSNQIKNSTNLILNGGQFSTGATTGFGETLGTLTLSSNSSIDLGTGLHLLNFANSSAIAWSGTLTIYDWVGMANSAGTAGRIFFGVGGLTTAQLAQISFNGYGTGAMLLNTGELVPIAIPEAGIVIPAIVLVAAVGYRERRRLAELFARFAS